MNFNRGKFKNLVHYICEKCVNPNDLGATKLNKILYYSDLFNYLYTGSGITNEIYVKQQFGPVPRDICSVLEELKTDRKIMIREVDYFGKPKREFISFENSNIDEFTAREISLVDSIIDLITKEHTAASISEKSHDDIWILAEIGEEIPYYTVFVSNLGEVTKEDVEWATNELTNAA